MNTVSICRARAARALALAAVASFAFSAAPAEAGEYSNEVGVGVGSAFASLLYAPAKLIYAGGGTLVAGLAYAASGGDSEVARPIMNAALLGDYVVTPAHLRREQSLEFVGKAPEHLRIERDLEAELEAEQELGATGPLSSETF